MKKGNIIITVLTLLLGISAVATFSGLQVVDGPEGALCISAADDSE